MAPYYIAEPVNPLELERGGYYMGQEPPIDMSGGDVPTDSDVSSFSSWYSQYQALWTDFLAMDSTIQDHLARWADVAAAASAAGDTATEDQATQRIAWLQTARDTRNQVQATVERFSGAWESFRSYVAAAGRWFGLQSLGLAPLILPFAIAAAIAGLAYVVTKIIELRNGLNYDTQLLQAVEAGRLTADQAAKLKRRQDSGGGFSTTTLLLGGVAVVAGLSFFGFLGGRR